MTAVRKTCTEESLGQKYTSRQFYLFTVKCRTIGVLEAPATITHAVHTPVVEDVKTWRQTN